MIHANSDTMWQWLWKGVLNNVGSYESDFIIIHAAGTAIGIFMVCTALDMTRKAGVRLIWKSA